jgi:GAF domain-containing protein
MIDVAGPHGDADGTRAKSRFSDDPLAGSIAALARLSALRLSLEDLLTEVASGAVRAIHRADGAGLTLVEADRPDTVVTTAPFVREVDNIQSRLGEGPCISVLALGKPMRSGSIGGDHRWPRFGARVGRLDVHSVLSLPLISADQVVGAINVYAHGGDAFDERAEQVGQLFAVPAAIAVQNAHTLAQTQRQAEKLKAEMAKRSVVDQAIGIVMSRSGVTSDQAMDRLRAISQQQAMTLTTAAEKIVSEAVRRARARHQHDT